MLADLDELVLRCRDERAKAYIGEAVACYQAGAYRAAIISTWIAVAFDVIDKIRELSFSGDKAALEVTEAFDTITRDHDLTRALQFERDLLNTARDRFELISAQEFLDLERLREDRHRCAHPSRTSATQVFTPPAELARAHIRAAVDHLLQHEPAQGKAAFDSILKTIESDYFPTKPEQALAVLTKTPLRRARASLVRNLIIVLVKSILHREPGGIRLWQRRKEALMCIRTMHPALWHAAISENLSRLIRSLETAAQLSEALDLMDFDSAIYDAVEEDQLVRLGEFIKKLPKEGIYLFSSNSAILRKPLKDAALERLRHITIEEMSDIEFFGGSELVWDAVVRRYSEAASFDTANAWGKVVASNAQSFNPAQVRALLQSGLDNNQVRGSFSFNHVLKALEQKGKLTTDLTPLVERLKT